MNRRELIKGLAAVPFFGAWFLLVRDSTEKIHGCTVHYYNIPKDKVPVFKLSNSTGISTGIKYKPKTRTFKDEVSAFCKKIYSRDHNKQNHLYAGKDSEGNVSFLWTSHDCAKIIGFIKAKV